MKKRHKILILITLIFTFLLVYQPHLSYHWPLHIDEWHHISEGIRMSNYGAYFEMLRGNTTNRFQGLEVGFHFFLFMISWIFNLVWFYQFLPALWAVFSAIALFYVAYKKTNRNFIISWLTIIFFASIRSNVNLTGLWFFTPLTFAIPFIFLYIYFFSEGLEKQRRKYILISLAIMVFLIITHSISVLFAIPALLIYLAINYKYLLKEYKFFSVLLFIPLIGVVFYKYTLAVPWPELAKHILNSLQFRYGWGVLEIHNSLTEVYHWIGYFLAAMGVISIIALKNSRKYLLYLLWPATTFAMVIIYKLTGVSFFSPYQRNLYYFALSLPLLSAIGLYTIIVAIKKYLYQLISSQKQTNFIKKFITLSVSLRINEEYVKIIQSLITTLIVSLMALAVLLLAFTNYYNPPAQVALYHVIEERHYKALEFIAKFPPTTVMATPFVSTALYPITGHTPVGTVFFYGDKKAVENFFLSPGCEEKNQIIQSFQVRYIISPVAFDCGWELLYNQQSNYVYKVNEK